MRIGIDPGTSRTRVALEGSGVVLQEPSVLVVDRDCRVRAVGEEARAMLGRTPDHLQPLRPLRRGRVEDPEAGRELLRRLLQRAVGWRLGTRPAVAVSVPADLTDFEKQALQETLAHAGARKPELVERTLAAARGAGVPLDGPEGTLVVDIGSGSTEVGLVSLRSLVATHSVPVGGDDLDEAVVRHLRLCHNLDIGPGQAETLKFQLGSATPPARQHEATAVGRDLSTGRPRTVRLTDDEVRPALLEPLERIALAVRNATAEAPPVLAEDLVTHGLVLTGGTARLPGLDRFLSDRLGLPVRVAESPESCVALGTVAGR